jgi:thioesterase domain-containing protein/acyl carrier protein
MFVADKQIFRDELLGIPDERADEDVPCDDVFVFPTTAAQRRYWLLDQLEPGNPALNMPLALRLAGPLDVEALERGLNEIVRRHELLRTSFETVDGQVMQVIAPAVTLTLENAEPGEATDANREERVRQVMVEEARRPFTLERAPLIRASLLRVSHDDHVLLLTMHHTVCDGWSNGILVRELGDLYAAFALDLPSPLTDLPLQYADYAHWQQEWLGGDGCDEQLAYWRKQLAGCSPALNLPIDRPRRRMRSAPGAVESLLLPAPLARAIRAFAKREDATMFMVFLAAFNVLLYRYTGQQDILVGSPIANRGSVETEGLIGLFANTLILRTRPSGAVSFRDFLAQVRDVSLDAVAHEDVPFEKVLEELQRVGGPSRAQPFHAMFIYQTAFMQPREAAGLTMTPLRSVSPGSLLDVTQSVVERAEGLRLQLEYDTDLFDAATAARMQGHFQTLLAEVVSNPDRLLSELPILTLVEREQFLPETMPLRLDETIDRAALPAPGRAQSAATSLPRDPIESSLKQIWEETLGVRPIGIRDDFFELGGRSLLAVLLMDRIERVFGKKLPLTTLHAGATIEHFASALHSQGERETHLPVLEIQTGGVRPPLFFLHGDLHGAGFYCRNLARHMGEEQPFYALQPHGIDGQDVPLTIEAMAVLHLAAVRARQPHGPYFLGGYCNGALIAYEMARLLEKQGEAVDLLALIHASARNARFNPLRTMVRSVAYPLGLGPNEQLRWFVRTRNFLVRLGDLPARERALFTAEKIRKTVSFERPVNDAGDDPGRAGEAPRDRFDRYKAIYAKYCAAIAGYIPARYSGRVTLFWPCEDATKPSEDAAGWRDVAGSVEVHMVPGQHMTCITEHVEDLADGLRVCLLRAQGGVSNV